MIAAGFDFLRGFGIVQVPQYGEFMSLYRPESYWYFARGVISTLLLLVFEIVERAAATHLSMFFGNRPHMISDSIPGEQTNNNR
ncbi:hypothetical protein A9762_02730 [Pandoraea sp. ISTKB]|nr:hypothetical protein A9762_02730 [Pandoraea sp. ISTKB]